MAVAIVTVRCVTV